MEQEQVDIHSPIAATLHNRVEKQPPLCNDRIDVTNHSPYLIFNPVIGDFPPFET